MFKQISFVSFLLLFANNAGIANFHTNGTRAIRFLGATQLTGEQLNSNFKGSASIVVLYTEGVVIGALIAKDKVLFPLSFPIGFYEIKVPALTYASGDNVENEEVYSTGSIPGDLSVLIPGRTLSTYEFGPISPNSKAVIATLPHPGSLPPRPGTSECVVCTYGSTGVTPDADNYILGYLPLTIIDMSKCTSLFGPHDDKLYFCATAKSPSGTEPGCSIPDRYRVVMCPENSLSIRNYDGKMWCIKTKLWWWWCPEEDEFSEPGWILTGLSRSQTGLEEQHCNQNSEFIMLFDYTNI